MTTLLTLRAAALRFRNWSLAACLLAAGCGSVEVTGPNGGGDAASTTEIQDGTSNTIAVGETPAGAGRSERDAQTALADKFFEFGASRFFSGGSITDNNELELCGVGQFGLRITRITSTSLDTFSSESTLFGRWSVTTQNGGLVLVLDVTQASDANDVGQRRLAVRVNGGQFAFDGAAATVSSAAADCATLAPRS